jgi:hypothetical protein
MYVAMLTAIDADERCFLAMTADYQRRIDARVEADSGKNETDMLYLTYCINFYIIFHTLT